MQLLQMKVATIILFIFCPILLTPQSLHEIMQLIHKGNIQEAEQMLTISSNAFQESDSLLFIRGLINTSADSATRIYQKLLTHYPKSNLTDEVQYRLGQYSYARGLYKAAINHFKQLVFHNTDSSLHQKSNYWIAQCYLATEQKDSAECFLRHTINHFDETAINTLARRDLKSQHPMSGHNKPDEPPAYQEKHSDAGDTGKFTIQVGAFINQTSAIKEKAKFEHLGYKVRTHTKKKSGKQLFLVWIGAYTTKTEAMQIAEKIKTDHARSYIIVSMDI